MLRRAFAPFATFVVIGCTSGCGFEHGSVSADAAIDSPPDAVERPASCLAIQQMAPNSPSGSYIIDPDGLAGSDPAFMVTCDMTTDGGGWTIAFIAPTPNVSGSVDWTSATPRLLTEATRALLAYRASDLSSLPDYASFDLPAEWKAQFPLKASATDLNISVRVNSASDVATTLRFGTEDFTDFCDDSWNLTQKFGRLCIRNSKAPYYTGYASALMDGCSDSMSGWQAHGYCMLDRRFSIAVR